jgi:hypothetical protein
MLLREQREKEVQACAGTGFNTQPSSDAFATDFQRKM